jgi:hypothetical protein
MKKAMSIQISDAVELLTKMIECKAKLEKRFALGDSGILISPESPLVGDVWEAFDLMLSVVGQLLGDQLGCLEWFVWENDCGKKELEHSLASGKLMAVRSAHDLLEVLKSYQDKAIGV